MAYYCFLCNENHEDSFTKEHFIPRSIKGLKDQWMPVCKTSNTISNSVFDNHVRDILYMARHHNTNILKRSGEAILSNGTLKRYRFSYDESKALNSGDAFQYFFEKESNTRIPSKDVYAIKFSVGLNQTELEKFCRGLAKISIGSLAYLLRNEGIQDEIIKQIFSQTSIDSVRHFALNLPYSGKQIFHRFYLGRTDVISKLQSSCKNPMISNHVIQIYLKKNNLIHIEGMLYSKYGWQLNLSNRVLTNMGKLRLENPISDMSAPKDQRDMTLLTDSICIYNPNYKGKIPNIPEDWKNSSV